MSLTWTEAPAAHAAQIYTESDELADSVAAYFAAGFDEGEPAILVASATHTSLVLERLAAAGWDAMRIDTLGLLVSADADATLEQIMDGPLPGEAAFERLAGGLLDELAARFPETRVRVYGEMVDLLCQRGQQQRSGCARGVVEPPGTHAPILAPLRLSARRLRPAVAGRTLPDVCSLHTHVVPSAR